MSISGRWEWVEDPAERDGTEAPREASPRPGKEVIRLETAARGLAGTRIRRDKKRTELGVMEPRTDARPARDLALFELLIGTGLRVAAEASLDIAQFSGRNLLRVKEKGSQEREVVMSSKAAEALTQYLRTERGKDAAFGDATQALFLSVPTQARNLNPQADGRMSSRSIFSVVRNLVVDALGEIEAKRLHPHLFSVKQLEILARKKHRSH